jgi:tetratricopeptide (TPR) repeat protein
VLLVATFAAYWPALTGKFVWDDDAYVEHNETLRTPAGLYRIWCDVTATPQYYPLVHTTFWIEYQLVGLTPTVYHVTNVFLHALSAWLLARLLLRLGIRAALVASVVFALHPVAVESVAWITERKNVLSLVFYLLSFTCYWPIVEVDRAADGSRRGRPQRWGRYALALVCYVAALLSKTVACSLPAAILLMVYLKYGRITRRDVQRLLPFFAVGLLLALNTAWLERAHVGARGPEFAIPLAARFIIAGRAIWFYLGQLVWPATLAFSYERWPVEAFTAADSLYPVSVVAGLVLLWLARMRWGRGPLVAALFFGGTLLPALGFIDVYPFRYSFVADHFQYLAMLGPIVLFAAVVTAVLDRRTADRPGLPRSLAVATATLAVGLGTLTWLQAHDYRNLETLWVNTIAKCPRAALALRNLAGLRNHQGRGAEAAELLQRVLVLRPDAVDVQADLADTLFGLKRFDESRRHYQTVLELGPDFFGRTEFVEQAQLGLARLSMLAGDQAETARRLQPLADASRNPQAAAYAHTVLARRATEPQAASRAAEHRAQLASQLDSQTDQSAAWKGHAMALADSGDAAQAAEAFLRVAALNHGQASWRLEAVALLLQAGRLERALRVAQELIAEHPTLAGAHANLGAVLAMQGDLRGATQAFRRSLQLFPGNAEVRANLAMALLQTGQAQESLVEFRKALAMEPQNDGVARQCAWVLATHPDVAVRSPAEALSIAQRFARGPAPDPRWFDVLAAAQAATGDFAAALQTAARGEHAAKQAGAGDLAQVIARRRALFASRQPFVDLSFQPKP